MRAAALQDDQILWLEKVSVAGIQSRRGDRVARLAAWFRVSLSARCRVPKILGHRPGQHFKEIAHLHRVEDSVANPDVADVDRNELLWRKPARIGTRVDLVE